MALLLSYLSSFQVYRLQNIIYLLYLFQPKMYDKQC